MPDPPLTLVAVSSLPSRPTPLKYTLVDQVNGRDSPVSYPNRIVLSHSGKPPFSGYLANHELYRYLAVKTTMTAASPMGKGLLARCGRIYGVWSTYRRPPYRLPDPGLSIFG